MNACSVATRPTSKRKKTNASGKVSGAEGREAEQDGEPAAHEQEQQVAGEDVGEESHGERDEPHEVREHLDDEDQGLADGFMLSSPAGSQLFR